MRVAMSSDRILGSAGGPREWRFETPEAQASALAAAVCGVLEESLRARAQASLVVSGGRTPAALFAKLASAPLEWSRVHVTLADERWVDPSSDSSNEHLVRTT